MGEDAKRNAAVAAMLKDTILGCDTLALDDEGDRDACVAILEPVVSQMVAYATVYTLAMRAAVRGWGATGVECIEVAVRQLKEQNERTVEACRRDADTRERVFQVMELMRKAGAL